MICVGLRMFYDHVLSLYSGVYILDQVYMLIHFMSLCVKFIPRFLPPPNSVDVTSMLGKDY